MPQCKMDGCRLPALPTGKRYCPVHKEIYLEKKRKYLAIQETLRECTCCGEKLSKTRHDNGAELCSTCEEKRIQEAQERRKWREFMEAETVSDLKEWIMTHMLTR